MTIGITERGDAGIDMSWTNKIHKVDGVILITKNITDAFAKKVIALHKNNYKIIVHCTCTGWGNSYMEPNVPSFETQIKNLDNLIKNGFPISQIVLRIDPIFPTAEGLQRVYNVLNEAHNAPHLNKLQNVRIRISIYDEYAHIRKRLQNNGLNNIYNGALFAPDYLMTFTRHKLKKFAETYNIRYECCAEPKLSDDIFDHCGCISNKDLSILGLDNVPETDINKQNRYGCLCLSCKKELLTNRQQCPHKCLYCYWK